MRESYGLSGSFAEVIEFCASCFSTSNWADIDNVRGMKGEDTLDSFIGDNSADGEGFANAATFACDYRSGEYLDALLVTFLNLAADIHGVAYFEMRYIFLETFAFNSIKQFCFHAIFSHIIYYFLLTIYYRFVVQIPKFLFQ